MNYITILFVILTVILVIHTELGPGHKKQAQRRKGFIKKPANLNKKPRTPYNQSQPIL